VRERVPRIETIRIRRRYWRVLAPKWAHAPLSGAGAARHGGRYNLPGAPALYLSEDLLVAVAEYEQELGLRPGTFCAYEVDVSGAVDLVDDRVRAVMPVTLEELLCPWQEIAFVRRQKPPTWAVVERLQAAGCSGARVPSAVAPTAVNLVLWRWNDAPDRRVVAHDPRGDLPVDQSAWRA
jgi:RES domain-containing protein